MPYQAPGVNDPRQSWILTEINKAQGTLDASIDKALALPESNLTRSAKISRYNALKRELGGAFNDLDKSVRIWAERDVPSMYKSGWFVGAAQTGANFDFTLPHREALEVLSFDAYDDVATRLLSVNNGFDDTIELQKLYEGLSLEDQVALQARTRSAVAQALLTGNADPKKVARGLAQDLWRNNPKLKIIDAGGKQWKMETYTRMLVRTKSGNAYNAGSLNKYVEEGVSQVKVFDGVKDDPCQKADGSTWPMRKAMANVLAHPNCVRAFGPINGFSSPDVDSQDLVVDGRQVAYTFDRVELTLTAIAALRRFRQTGQIDTSATLARVVFEVAESLTIPLPIIDGFVMGLASRGFREADAWLESLIDPVLFSAGVLKTVPVRAELIKASRPANFMDKIADHVRRASIEAFGSETNPRVQEVLDSLSAASLTADTAINFVRRSATAHTGGLKWVEWAASGALDTNAFGKTVAQTLRRVRDGEDISQAFEASKTIVDQFTELRALHMVVIRGDLEDLAAAYKDVDRLVEKASELLALGVVGNDDLPEWFALGIRAYGITADDLLNTDTARRELLEFIVDATSIQNDMLVKMNQINGVTSQTTARRLLNLPASIGPDVPTDAGIGVHWEQDLFDIFTDEIIDNFDAISVAPSIQIDIINDFKRFIISVERTDPLWFGNSVALGEPPPNIMRLYRDLLGDDVIDLVDWDSGDDVAELIGKAWTRFSLSPNNDFNISWAKRQAITSITQDRESVEIMLEVIRRIDGRYWFRRGDEIMEHIKVKFPARVKDTFARHASYGRKSRVRSRGGSVEDFILRLRDVMDDEVANARTTGRVTPTTSGFLQSNLENMYGNGNVTALASGIHGQVYLVATPNGSFVVKPLAATGHTGTHGGAMSSVILNSWLADLLGSDVVPYRVFDMGGSGDHLVVSPFVSNTREWGSRGAKDVADSDIGALRRLHLFHEVSMEADGNGRNFMIDTAENFLIRIDHETSFALTDFIEPEGPAGILSFANNVIVAKLDEEWANGVNRLIATQRDLPLYKLSREEFRAWSSVAGKGHDLSLASQGSVTGKISDMVLPTGTRSPLTFTNDFGESVTKWVPVVSLTDSELEFFLKVMRDPDDLLDDIIDILTDGLKHTDIDAVVADMGFTDIEELAGQVVENLQRRISVLVDTGIVDITGGVTEFTNKAGTKFKVGDVVKVRRATSSGVTPPGHPTVYEGLVTNIFEDSAGITRARIVQDMGVGKTSTEINKSSTSFVDFVVDVERHVDDSSVPLTVRQSVVRSKETAEATLKPHQAVEVDLDPLAVKTPQLDELGLLVDYKTGSIIVGRGDDANDGFLLVDTLGNVGSMDADELFNLGRGRKILEEELSKVPAQYRPKEVKIYTGMLETSDGVPTHGFFDADTKVLHLSIASVDDLPTQEVVSKALFGLRKSKSATVVKGSLTVKGNVADQFNWELLQEVIAHEVGHGVHVGMENQRKAIVRADLVDQMLDALGDADPSVSDMLAFARDQLPVNFVIPDEASDALDALLTLRADLVEDIINTNLVHLTEDLLETIVREDVVPLWVSRISGSVKRKDAGAHHEFFAEVWSAISRNGGGRLGLENAARDLGVSPIELRRYLDPVVPSLPAKWSVTDPEFALWLSQVLHENATAVIPIRNSPVRRLWDQTGFTESLKFRVFKLAEEEGGGGFTYNVATGQQEVRGTAVAILENQKILIADTEDELELAWQAAYNAYEKKHQVVLRSEDFKLGGWKTFNEDTGKWEFYFDTVRIFDDELDAAKFGFKERQLAMYNLETFEETNLLKTYGSFEEFLEAEIKGTIPYEELVGRTQRVAGVQKKTTSKGVVTLTDVEYVNGRKRAPVTMDVFSDADKKKLIRIAEKRYSIKLTPELMEANAERVLKEGLLRFSPAQLKSRYRFYEVWNEEYVAIARRHDSSPARLMAAAAVISPKRDAINNFSVIALLSEILYVDKRFTAVQVRAAKEVLLERRLDYIGYGKPNTAQKFLDAANALRVGSRPSDFDSDVVGYVVNEIIKDMMRTFRPYTGILGDGRPYVKGVRSDLGLINQQDYSKTGMRAIQVLRGELSVDESIRGGKVRSFLNNQIDPLDFYGNRDITVDFHMANLLAGALGADAKGVALEAYGTVSGISIGLKGYMADTLRGMYDAGWADRLGIESDAQFQEILWGLWREGLEHGWWGDLEKITVRSDFKA